MIKFIDPRIEEKEVCRIAAERRRKIKTSPAKVDSHTYILVREKPDEKLTEQELKVSAEIFRKKWKENQENEEKHPRHIYLSNQRQFTENI